MKPDAVEVRRGARRLSNDPGCPNLGHQGLCASRSLPHELYDPVYTVRYRLTYEFYNLQFQPD